jgi:hypothetical protein
MKGRACPFFMGCPLSTLDTEGVISSEGNHAQTRDRKPPRIAPTKRSGVQVVNPGILFDWLITAILWVGTGFALWRNACPLGLSHAHAVKCVLCSASWEGPGNSGEILW